MTFVTKQDLDSRQMDEKFEAQCQAGLEDIYKAYPTLVRCEATSKEIRRLIADFMEGTFQSTVPTQPLFDLMITTNGPCGLPVKSIQDQCDELIDAICELLRNPQGGTSGGKYSDHNLKTYRTNVLRFQTKEALQARKAEILEAQRLAAMSPEAIKAQLKAQRHEEIMSGKLPSEFTKEVLVQNIAKLKFCVRNWGMKAVNDRLAGRS